MTGYISREALLAEIAADYGKWISCNDTDELYRQGVEDNYSDTIRLINDMPSANVQQVVHCKDCRYAQNPNDSMVYCKYFGCGAMSQNDFCSQGELLKCMSI